MIGIYKITNKINGKAYVGQSKHIKRRWREHVNGLENSTIGNAIKKYGEENFSFEILESCSIEELNDREIYYIDKLDTYGKGYNVTTGGDGVKGVGKVLTPECIPKIISDLRDGLPSAEIAQKFNVCVEMISRINNGNAWAIESETYPIRERYGERVKKEINREELLETVATLGFKGAGEKYGLTGNGIKARCEMVGLPIHIKEIRELYGIEEVFIEAIHKEKSLHVETVDELVEYIFDNRLTSANWSNIKASVRRVLRGERKSYLGITIKIKK